MHNSWSRLLSSLRNPDPDLAIYHHYRTHQELTELSLADYIDLASWLPHPHLRPQLDFLGPAGGSEPDPQVTVFHQERLGELETSLSAHCAQPVKLPHHNPARRAAPELPEDELQSLEQQVRWLYAADGHSFGYNR